ncbi:MAG: cyclic nucleotide-binding domain-containing protein [Hyphomicrobiales bacterium]|nr:cyclic nucleotide-binding domain-containing protein [Hyphomicrobiales bacterium]
MAATGVFGGVSLAVAAGIAAACLLFALACARLPVIRNDLSGVERRSRLDRPQEQVRLLDELGKNIRLIDLQGVFFFGSANSLVEHVRQHIASGRMGRSSALILDFKRVIGLDSAAVVALAKVRQLIAAADGVLVLVGLTPAFAQALRRSGKIQDDVPLFEDADLALEWCEERALKSHPRSRDGRRGFDAWLAEELGGSDAVALLKRHLRRQNLRSGEILFSEGAPADALFFVEAGRVSVAKDVGSSQMIRLRTTLECTIIGEVALYLGGIRTATVVADTPVIVHELTGLELARIEAAAPHLAIALHRMIAQIDAERLRFTTRVLQALH